MPSLNKYFSQLDADHGTFTGLCAETCLKMADTYYHDREIPLTQIVAMGDGDGSNTSEAGAIKTAKALNLQIGQYNGKDVFWGDITQADLKLWLGNGNLVMAFINYSLVPDVYKQDLDYPGIHAILLTAITDDGGAVRYADPYFSDNPIRGYPGKRENGWMKNNKWITWAELSKAWAGSYRPYP